MLLVTSSNRVNLEVDCATSRKRRLLQFEDLKEVKRLRMVECLDGREIVYGQLIPWDDRHSCVLVNDLTWR